MRFLVKQVSYQTVLPLRSKILRPWLKPEEATYPKDRLTSTYHFAAFENDKIIGVATFEMEEHPDLPSQLSYRLRGMATAEDFRGKGVGRALLTQAETWLKNKKAELLWFNAREVAFPFYLALKYKFYGEVFELPQIGVHKVMYKYFVAR